MMNIGIAGCAGRMGAMLIEAVREHPKCTLSATSARTEGLETVHTYLQREGLQQVMLTDRPDMLVQHCDAVIDFTSADYSMDIVAACAKANSIYICGTTGFTTKQEADMLEMSRHMRVVKAANFSIGVNLLMELVERAAHVMAEADIEISETHHRYKKDAPSGTALALGRAAARGRNVSLDDVAVHGRHGMTGERTEGTIGFHALRGGDVIGDHTVLFAENGERLSLSHMSSDRRVYADGAIRAALWCRHQSNGMYAMQDVLRP